MDHNHLTAHPGSVTPKAMSIGIVILNYNTSKAVIDLYEHITTLRQGFLGEPYFLVVDN